jgi:hypothetical protein
MKHVVEDFTMDTQLAAGSARYGEAQIAAAAQAMEEAIADCLVSGYKYLIDGLKLPDPDDRHVLAAA